MKKLVIIITIISTIAIVVCCKINNKETEPIVPIAKIKTENVEEITEHYSIHTSGKISSKEELKLSFKTGGVIDEIEVSEGERVKQGKILARLNLSEMMAHVKQAKLGYEKSKRDYERAKNLYQDSVATLEQLENAKTALDFAKSSLKIAEFNLKYSSIKAPYDGTILKQLTRENELIAPGYPVFLFGSDEENWVLRVGITDKEVVHLQKYDSAKVETDAYPNLKFNGAVMEIGKFADPYTGTYEVEIEIDANEKKFASGMIAKANIKTRKKETFILVPYSSMIEANEFSGIVYKIVDNQIIRQKVHVGKIADKGLYISDGLKNGDKVIIDGVNNIKPGDEFEEIK